MPVGSFSLKDFQKFYKCLVANKYSYSRIQAIILTFLDLRQKSGAARNEIIKIMLQEELLVMSAESLNIKINIFHHEVYYLLASGYNLCVS